MAGAAPSGFITSGRFWKCWPFAEFSDGLTNTVALVENATINEWTRNPARFSHLGGK